MKNSNKNFSILNFLMPFLIIIALIIIFNSFCTVPTGYVGIRTKFGKADQDVVQEGLNMKVPVIERIVLMDCRTQKAEIDCSTASRDLQEVTLKVAVNYNVSIENAYNITIRTNNTQATNETIIVKINGEVVIDGLTPIKITPDLVISKGKSNYAKFVK